MKPSRQQLQTNMENQNAHRIAANHKRNFLHIINHKEELIAKSEASGDTETALKLQYDCQYDAGYQLSNYANYAASDLRNRTAALLARKGSDQVFQYVKMISDLIDILESGQMVAIEKTSSLLDEITERVETAKDAGEDAEIASFCSKETA